MTTNDKLTLVLLNDNNYQVWVRQATFGLINRDKFEHVTGDKKRLIPAGATATDAKKASIKKWDKDDTLVIGWLLASMETQISDLMTYQNTSQEIWDKTAARFARKKNFARVYQIQQEIQQLQHAGKTTSQLFNEIQQKRDEIKVYRSTTGDLDELKRREEQDEIFIFLAKLDDSYEAVRSQILLSTDLPPLDEVAALIEGEETRREVMGHHASANPEGQAFGAFTKTFAKQYNLYNPRSTTIKKCDHCKKEGHNKDECWFLYPELRPQSQRRRRDANEGEVKWKRGFVTEARGANGEER
jgi:gag-polypeptide of LTR copia-type